MINDEYEIIVIIGSNKMDKTTINTSTNNIWKYIIFVIFAANNIIKKIPSKYNEWRKILWLDIIYKWFNKTFICIIKISIFSIIIIECKDQCHRISTNWYYIRLWDPKHNISGSYIILKQYQVIFLMKKWNPQCLTQEYMIWQFS